MSTKSCFPVDAPIVAPDTKTSGLDPFKHSLISFALVPVASGPTPLVQYLSTGIVAHWDPWAYDNFRKDSDNYTMRGVSVATAYKAMQYYIAEELKTDEIVIVGHNVWLDMAFMKQLAHRANRSFAEIHYRSVDTFVLMYDLYMRDYTGPKSLSLSGACKHFNVELPEADKDTALGDATAVMQLYKKIAEHNNHMDLKYEFRR